MTARKPPKIVPCQDEKGYIAHVPGFFDADCHPVTRHRHFLKIEDAEKWVAAQAKMLESGKVLS